VWHRVDGHRVSFLADSGLLFWARFLPKSSLCDSISHHLLTVHPHCLYFGGSQLEFVVVHQHILVMFPRDVEHPDIFHDVSRLFSICKGLLKATAAAFSFPSTSIHICEWLESTSSFIAVSFANSASRDSSCFVQSSLGRLQLFRKPSDFFWVLRSFSEEKKWGFQKFLGFLA
jgi:hypothetical protein